MQWGYFKAAGRFFKTRAFSPADIVFVTRQLGLDPLGLDFTTYDLEVMNQTKHRTTVMIQRYDRRRNIRKHNASGKLGL